MWINELREILVTRRNHYVDALGCGMFRQGADDVVGLNAVDGQDGPAGGLDAGVYGGDLQGQVVWHRRAMGLVVRIPVVAEGLALGVEDASLVSYILHLEVAVQPAQHVEHAVDGAGRLSLRVAQVGHGMEGAV